MSSFILAFAIFVLAVAGMAAGVLLGRRPLAGSCGGLGASACGTCAKPCEQRRQAQQSQRHEGAD